MKAAIIQYKEKWLPKAKSFWAGLSKDSKIILMACGIILSIWFANWFFLSDKPLDVRGTFGDMFGAINALFSGFAFLSVIYAILLQRTELSLQREELAMTRAELAKAAEAQEKSEKALAKQAIAMERTVLIQSLTAALKEEETMFRSVKNYLNISGTLKEEEISKKNKAELIRDRINKIQSKLNFLIQEIID
ncbi:hypothetical protein [Photobacterium sp. R1]